MYSNVLANIETDTGLVAHLFLMLCSHLIVIPSLVIMMFTSVGGVPIHYMVVHLMQQTQRKQNASEEGFRF